MGMILAKNVSKIYETGSKKTYALSDVSFEIDKGEFVVILGQSGAVIIPGLFEPPVRTLRATIPENESHIFR